MNIIQFLQFFLIITTLGALSVTGWFFITRGDEEILPDGSGKKVGKIFKGWYFFWTKEKKPKHRIYYRGDELDKLIAELRSNFPSIDFVKDGNGFIMAKAGEKVDEFIDDDSKKMGDYFKYKSPSIN